MFMLKSVWVDTSITQQKVKKEINIIKKKFQDQYNQGRIKNHMTFFFNL